MNSRTHTIIASLGIALAVAAPAGAQEAPDREGSQWYDGTVSLQIENDKISRTDRHYTNGFRLAWVSDRKEGGPGWMRDTLDFLYPSSLKAARIGFSFGQTIFTPNDTEARELIRDDRPYAGWLFAGASLHGESQGGPLDILDTVEVTVGIIGPQAYGGEVQNNVHSLIGTDEANGWDNQLQNEPALNLMLERRWRLHEPLSFLGLKADAIPHIGGSAGNVFTFGGTGLILRLGQGLGIDYGPAHIQPSLSGPELMTGDNEFAWYLFAGAEGRAVLRNIFLDGNSFADSHGVDHKPFVADFQVGLTVAYQRVRASLAMMYRTKEFDGQHESDTFGALNLSWHF